MGDIGVYLETGKRRTFAGAIDWPGWTRSGGNETAALQALADFGPRYGRALAAVGLDFDAPAGPATFAVVERLEGDATTDFGAPGVAPSADAQPVDADGLHRMHRLLETCWWAFDAAVLAATGQELRRGPRGGGRDLNQIIRHLLESDAGYLARVGHRFRVAEDSPLCEEMRRCRLAVREALEAVVRGEVAPHGPRGGARWTLRYYVRRVAWHTLDHAWEIEDRIV